MSDSSSRSKSMSPEEQINSASDDDRSNRERPRVNGSDITMISAEELRAWSLQANADLVNEALMESGSEPPKPPLVTLTPAKLHPLVPSVLLDDPSLAFGNEIVDFCRTKSIVSLRGVGTAANFNFGLFTTKTLMETMPRHEIEIRLQKKQSPQENLDEKGNRVWKLISQTDGSKSLNQYARVQVFHYNQEQELAKAKKLVPGTSSREVMLSTCSSSAKGKKKVPTVELGTDLDLRNNIWQHQFAELNKLPRFLCVNERDSLLNYLGFTGHEISNVHLYLKVGGCRTPAQQAHLPSVHVNIGPAICQWFAVPVEYWGAVYKLCKKNRCDYLHDTLWPNIDELRHAGIPVYLFQQGSGDIIWVNSGCIFWVHANGVCNNISWNVAPISAHHYRLVLDRYHWNKHQEFQSLVPMIRVSWSLAREYQVTDPELFKLIKTTMMLSLIQDWQHLKILEANNVDITLRGRTTEKPVYYCDGSRGCHRELFNFVFVGRADWIHYCVPCAERVNFQGYTCYQEYDWEDLMECYNRFALRN